MLLALWLPATQHCTLEAAGLIAPEAEHAETSSCCDTDERCSHDGCGLVENGLIKTADASFKVPAPDLSVCLCFLCVQLVLPAAPDAPAVPVTAAEHPLDWLPTWQFERRAAPPVRAPGCIV